MFISGFPRTSHSAMLPSAFHPPSNEGLLIRTRSTRRFLPFDQDLDEPIEQPLWQKQLDDLFARVFRNSIASNAPPTNDVVAQVLHILGTPTFDKLRGLALAVYAHWVRMQFHFKDASATVCESVAIIRKTSNQLGRTSPRAQRDLVAEFDRVCIEKLKLIWRLYVDVVSRDILPVPPPWLFMQVMDLVTMIAHLFLTGLVHHGAVLDGLRYIATMFPCLHALAVTYTFLHKLGPSFGLEPTVWQFIQHLLTHIFPLIAGRVDVEDFHQLFSAFNTLKAEWQHGAHVMLYHTYPKLNV